MNKNSQILPRDNYLIDMKFRSEHLNITVIEISSREFKNEI